MVPREEGPGGQASKWKERSPEVESRGSLFPTSSAMLVALFSRNFCERQEASPKSTRESFLKEWSCQVRQHVGNPGDPDSRETRRLLRGENMDLHCI